MIFQAPCLGAGRERISIADARDRWEISWAIGAIVCLGRRRSITDFLLVVMVNMRCFDSKPAASP